VLKARRETRYHERVVEAFREAVGVESACGDNKGNKDAEWELDSDASDSDISCDSSSDDCADEFWD
jgi:hypothetical protein